MFEVQQSDVLIGSAEPSLFSLESYSCLSRSDVLSFVDRAWTVGGSTAIGEIGATRYDFWRDSSLIEL